MTLGLINEKNNQMIDFNKQKNEQEEEVVQGTAEMLMKM